jgi:YidC/Oxa1 family membrane protein insertase
MRHELTWTNEKGNPQKYLYLATAGRIGRVVIDPQTLKEYKFKYFVGPKEIPVLKNFDESTTGIMHLSFLPDWFPGKSLFSLLAYWLLNALIFLKDSFCGTYGVSIIVLTLIVRTIFWPITQKANKSMKKMQKIQPMVKELKEKYPNDPQKMNSEVMRLYKEHKVNPLGGCLPILLQIPVFIALYSALYSSVELRQAAFLWASDLSRPDAIGPVIMGFQIHPLILIMTVLMLFQQKLTPSAADPMQQKMMMAMPLVMLVFLYSLPSGLTLYWTVSQIASIFQLLINRYLDKEEDQPVNPNQGTSKGKPGKPQKGELNK